MTYLQSWFDNKIISCIENLKEAIELHAGESAPIFLCIASNFYAPIPSRTQKTCASGVELLHSRKRRF